MLYFQEPVYIASIVVKYELGADFFFEPEVRVFTNGLNLYDGQYIRRRVDALYLRFSPQLSSIKLASADGKERSQALYDTTLCIGIQDIILKDSTGQVIDFVTPVVVKGKVTASSTLAPEASYSAAYVADSRYDFAWAEGAAGSGKGEQLTIELEKDITVDRLMIRNGYQRSDNHYADNARLASFSLMDGSEASIGTFSIQDERKSIIELPTTTSNTFVLNVEDIFEGGKYKDLVLSEIRFYHKGQPYLIQTEHEQNTMAANRKEANELLKSFLDKTISTSTSDSKEGDYFVAYNGTNRSLILRSNGSFVFYGEESFYEENVTSEEDYSFIEEVNTTVADGGWELIKQNEEEITIRIFGKIFQMTTNEELYRTSADYENTKVFQDYITLSASQVSSRTTFETMDIEW